MKILAISIAFIAGTIFAGQLLGQSMASLVEDTRSQSCLAGRVTLCDN